MYLCKRKLEGDLRKTEEGRQCNHWSGDWSDAATNQGMPATTGNCRGKEGFSPSLLEQPCSVSGHIDLSSVKLILDFWPPELWENKFLCFKPPSLWKCYSSHGELIHQGRCYHYSHFTNGKTEAHSESPNSEGRADTVPRGSVALILSILYSKGPKAIQVRGHKLGEI